MSSIRWLLVSIALALLSSGVVAEPGPVAIEAVRLVDLASGESRLVTVLLQSGRIAWIGQPDEASVPADAFRIDGRERWVVPGLIELHSHDTSEASLRRALALGVTTAHTIASPGMPLEILQRSNDPEEPMPRLQLTTGLFGEFPEHISPGLYEVRGPRSRVEARRDVQQLKLRGASAIKIWQDDGSLWFGEQRTFPPIPGEIFREIVAAGHDARLRVYAHAWERVYAEVAIASGVDSLIHPVIDGVLEDSAFEEMRSEGIGWATTMAVVLVYGDPQQYARRILAGPTLKGSLTEEEAERFRSDASSPDHQFHRIMPELAARRSEYLENIRRNTLRARELGVTIALGSDEIVGIGTHIEMELLQELGFRPLEVLAAATRGSATALGLEEAVGAVDVGKVADLLILRSDPSTDTRNVRDVEWIVKAGHPMRPAELRGPREQLPE